MTKLIIVSLAAALALALTADAFGQMHPIGGGRCIDPVTKIVHRC